VTPDDMTAISFGVDVGGTKILACATSPLGEVMAQAEVASPGDARELLGVIENLLVDLTSAFDLTRCRVEGLGVALPGLIGPGGTLAAAPNLAAPDVDIDLRTDLVAPLRKTLAGAGVVLNDESVHLDNDGTCAALAEVVCGAADGVSDAIVVSLGTGIGSGLIANGRLVRGARHYAGEVGHVVIEPDGDPCPCGKRGCWERYSSGGGLARLARVRLSTRKPSEPRSEMSTLVGDDISSLRAEHVIQAARSGDPEAVATLKDFSYWLALGLVNLTEIFDPQLIVLSGGLSSTAALWLDETREQIIALSRRATLRDHPDVVEAALGGRAAAIGAALLGLGVLGPG
jgi:glucokinase